MKGKKLGVHHSPCSLKGKKKSLLLLTRNSILLQTKENGGSIKLFHHIRQHSDGEITKCSIDLLPQKYMQENEIMRKTDAIIP